MTKLIRSLVLSLVIIVGEAQAELDVHFLNVGQGDCVLIVCDGEAMLIDGGQSSACRLKTPPSDRAKGNLYDKPPHCF